MTHANDHVWSVTRSVETQHGRVATGVAGSGPDLVLAHGWPWSSFAWHRVIPDLASSFRVHWYDMPGFGASDKGAGKKTSLDVQGEVFAEMLKHWQLASPRVWAHDFGGAVTMRAHLLHGCAFDRLILMNVVAMRPWGSAFFDHVGRHVAAFRGLPPHIHEAIVHAYIRGALVCDLKDDDAAKLAAPWLSDDGAASFYEQFAQADEAYTAEIEPDFGNLRCPTRVLWGADDPWIPLDRGRALNAAIGQAELITLDGLGHLPQLEAPQRVLDAARPFLSEARDAL